MSADTPSYALALAELEDALAGGDVKSCCAALYANPAVRWLMGDELHPGGEATTRRALQLIGLEPGERLLDVASGSGTSALVAAREHGARVTGVDYGEAAVRDAQSAASEAGLAGTVAFRVADAEALPFEDESFDAVLCECSLCTFPDKPRALAELRRVLRPGGRLVLADVVAEHRQLPAELRGPLATLACVGEALSRDGYERILRTGGFRLLAAQPCTAEAARMAERVHDRLRGVRVLGVARLAGSPLDVGEAISLARQAREAIATGALDYTIFAAER